jgi:hypothetical protein
MNDPFDILRERLVDAARGRPSWRRRRGGLAILTTVLVLSGAAAGAAVMLTNEPSKPPSGPVPDSSLTYSIELRPDLTAGNIGWCASLALRRGSTPNSFGSGCGPAPSPQRAQIIGIAAGGQRGGIAGMVVDGRVATVELPGGRRVTPSADRGVPAPWKIAVVALRGEPRVATRFLDAQGRRLPDHDPPGSWAAGSHRLPTRAVDATDPPELPCAIRAGRLHRLRAVSARVLTRFPTGQPDVAQPAFLSCATTVYYLGRTRLRAAVLVDAADSTAQAPLLPGMASEPAPGAIVATGRLLSARRAGPGWLAVFGGTASQRAQLVSVLSASP